MIYLVRLFWGVPALLLLALLWVLSSTAGSQLVLDQASKHSGGLLDAGEVTGGHLLGRLTVDRLAIRTPAAEVDLSDVLLNWSPLSLLRLRAQFDELTATSIDLRLLEVDTPPEETEAPGTPPSRLPMNIVVSKLAVGTLTVTPVEGAPIQIRDIAVHADWIGTQVQIHQLALDWVDQFPLSVKASADLSDTGVTIDRLIVTAPLAATLQGRYDWDGAFAADLGWVDARWPVNADAPALFESPEGRLQIDGRPEAYKVTLNARANSPDYAGGIVLEGEGGLEEIRLSTLDVKALEGRAQASGRVRWTPALDVDVTARMDNINPGVIAPQAPGRISGTIAAQGGLDADNPLRFKADIRDSELLNQPFALTAAGGWDQTREQLTLESARLSQGKTVLTAEGRAWPTLALTTRLESSDLSTLLPELRGRISLDAKVDGEPTLPSVTANGEGRLLGWTDQINIAELQLGGRFDPSGNIDLRLETTGISGVAEVDRAQLTARGSLADHRLQLDVDAPMGDAAVALAGAADLDRQRWQGTLEQLRLAVPRAPVVALENPAPLTLSADATRLQGACLLGADEARDQIKVCIDADVTPERVLANLLLDALDYALLTPFMPDGMSLSGSAAGRVDLQLPTGGAPEVDVDLETRQGAFEIRNRAALTLLPGHIRALENAEGLRLDADLPTADGGLSAALSAAPGDDPLSRALSGTVNAKLTDLDWINRLTGEIEELEGELAIDLDLAGVLGAPEVGGRVALSVPRVSVPQAGITLRDTVAEIFPDGGTQARVAVRTRAGDGDITIDGDIGWPEGTPQLALNITGRDAQVADLPDARVWINPDLKIGLADNRLEVSGRIDVPRAEITPRGGGDTGIGPTADQIIVRDGDQPASEPLMDVIVNVTVALGDAVSFSGFGLKTRFAGQLNARQQPGQPVTGRGEIRLVDGRYKAYGQDLEVTTGRVIFSGGPITDPGLDLRAIREPRPDIEVGVTVRGRLDKPEFALFSNPSMRQEEQLSWLVLGRGLSTGTGDDQAALSGAALALGLSGSDFLAQRLKGGLVDDISIGTSPGDDPDEARLTVGRYLTPELYISYGVGLFQPGHVFRLLYDIGRGFQLQTETGVATGADLLYTLER
ncbi:translocation/assembly module TamB domain-containing protein [Polycyclovorans algicola]|uniref:translocation/assembly module TamB domain-containing protein n=1 Tax=Polycyclovorans algicola TaxID=616992 RepID=UPI0004A75E56|nr:translocation/assembly module TamB domain-containing protein [Polycyclovorans algicola]